MRSKETLGTKVSYRNDWGKMRLSEVSWREKYRSVMYWKKKSWIEASWRKACRSEVPE